LSLSIVKANIPLNHQICKHVGLVDGGRFSTRKLRGVPLEWNTAGCVWPPHAPSSNSVRVSTRNLLNSLGTIKVIRKVIWSWAHLSSPVSVFIPTLVLSLKSPDRGPTRQKTGKTRMESPTWAHQTVFSRPGAACLLDHWLLATS